MDISLISITPITGNEQEQLAIRITDEGVSLALDVDTILALADWINDNLIANEGEDQGDEILLDESELLLEEPFVSIEGGAVITTSPPVPVPRAQRGRAREVDIASMVTDAGDGPMRVVRSPRPSV